MQNIVVVVVVLGVIFSSVEGKPHALKTCNTTKDCGDAGMMCMGGKCTCWTELGPGAADAWSCDDNTKCAASFPGHICKAANDCDPTLKRKGYCTPQ